MNIRGKGRADKWDRGRADIITMVVCISSVCRGYVEVCGSDRVDIYGRDWAIYVVEIIYGVKVWRIYRVEIGRYMG